MRDLPSIASFFAIATGMSLIIGASIISTPPPVKDALAYQECIEIRPQRHCAIVHLGAQ
jgi:hypothetical protein